MSWNIRELRFDDTLPLVQAFKWYQQMPPFIVNIADKFKKSEADPFVQSLQEGRNFAVEDHGAVSAVVHAEPKSFNLAEGHLFCKPGADIYMLAAGISFARVEVLKQYDTVICHVLRRHRALNRIMDLSGFYDTGLRAWQGVYRGSPQEVRYYIARRAMP